MRTGWHVLYSVSNSSHEGALAVLPPGPQPEAKMRIQKLGTKNDSDGIDCFLLMGSVEQRGHGITVPGGDHDTSFT